MSKFKKRLLGFTALSSLALLSERVFGADAYTPDLRIVQMVSGSNDATWGTKANAAFAMLEAAIADQQTIDVSAGGNVTLTANNNAADQARAALLIFTGSTGNSTLVITPNVKKLFWAENESTGNTTITAGSGANVTLSPSSTGLIYSDGSNDVEAFQVISSLMNPILADTTAGAVRTGLGAAASGANTDITSVVLSNTGLDIKDTSGNYVLGIVPGSSLGGNQTLTIVTGNASETLTISGNTSIGGSTSGTNTGDQTITLTGAVTGSGTGSFATTLAAGQAVSNLGYTPANIAGDTFTGPVIFSGGQVDLNYTPTSLNSDAAGFRGAPPNTQNGNYTFVIADDGSSVYHSSGTPHSWTINPHATTAYPSGDVMVLDNLGAGNVTVVPGAGVTLYFSPSGSTGNRTINQYGLATLYSPAADTWVISGGGVN